MIRGHPQCVCGQNYLFLAADSAQLIRNYFPVTDFTLLGLMCTNIFLAKSTNLCACTTGICFVVDTAVSR